MTEQDLRDRGIGKPIQPRDYGWDVKSRTYRELEVWLAFSKLRSKCCVEFTDETGYVDHGLVEQVPS